MSTFTLKFFAKLREETNTDQLVIRLEDVSRLSDLNPFLITQYPQWAGFLSAKLLTAVNQTMAQGDVLLRSGDEIALFPPVTGG